MTSIKRDLLRFLINGFKNRGVELKFTNPPKTWFQHVMPFVGRDHIKAGIIDDGKVVYFGGVNFDQLGKTLDFMVKFTGPVAVKIAEAHDRIYPKNVKEYSKENVNGLRKDESIQLDEHSQLVIDAGNKGQSLILEEAERLIKSASKSIENTSLAYPDGSVDKELSKKARNNVHTEVVVSSVNPSRSLLGGGRIFNALQRKNKLFSRLRRSRAHILVVPEFVHAKLLIIDRGTPQQKAYFGTHNLSSAGVKAGTREWGIFTTDPTLIANLGAFYDKAKGHAHPSAK